MSDYISIDGHEIGAESLSLPRARSLLGAIKEADLPYIAVVAFLRLKSGSEAIVFDAEVELGQEPPIPIQKQERLAVVFSAADDFYPEVYALRPDFPQVPHLNCGDKESPKSLCLYEEPWPEVKLRWTPSGFVERIRTWLALTAEGRLHGDDQPLEPLLLGRFWRLILPSDLFNAGPSEEPVTLLVCRTSDDPAFNVLVAQRPEPGAQLGGAFLATTFHTAPQQHGVIRHRPHSMADLHSLFGSAGVDLLSDLRKRLKGWDRNATIRKSNLIIVAYFPKTRTAGGQVEARDIWSFRIDGTMEEVGRKLGLWDIVNGHVAEFLSPDLSKDGGDILVDVLDTSFALSRQQAAALNGVSPSSMALTAIGAGALGSQVVPKLVQSGFGVWTIIDDDHLLPHNPARHQFSNCWVGQPKAELLAGFCDSFFEGTGTARGIVANVLVPGAKEPDVKAALESCEAIIDFSASVAVGRVLAHYTGAIGRRVSVFLNPTGRDLVVLAEDRARTATLDYLEMVYYSEIAARPELEKHLSRGEQRLRYGRSCRDLTSTIPEAFVGLHSAVASHAIRDSLTNESASISIWRADEGFEIKKISIPVPAKFEIASREWRVISTESVIARIRTFRKAKLPNETGGVLVGHFDSAAGIAYIMDTLPAPPDSKEYPVHYIRGSAGLRAKVEAIRDRTASMLHYIGEWHSHPDGYSCRPSGDDRKVFAWLTRWMQIDGYPGLMLIAGEREEVWFVEEMV